MSRTPYSPFVLKATAPEPWNGRRVCGAGVAVISLVRGRSSIPSDFVGISVGGPLAERQRASGVVVRALRSCRGTATISQTPEATTLTTNTAVATSVAHGELSSGAAIGVITTLATTAATTS